MAYLCWLQGELQNYDHLRTRREGWFLFGETTLVKTWMLIYKFLQKFLTTFAKFLSAIFLPKQTQKLFIFIPETCFIFLTRIRMYFFPKLSSALVLCFAKIIVFFTLYQVIRDQQLMQVEFMQLIHDFGFKKQ